MFVCVISLKLTQENIETSSNLLTLACEAKQAIATPEPIKCVINLLLTQKKW